MSILCRAKNEFVLPVFLRGHHKKTRRCIGSALFVIFYLFFYFFGRSSVLPPI